MEYGFFGGSSQLVLDTSEMFTEGKHERGYRRTRAKQMFRAQKSFGTLFNNFYSRIENRSRFFVS